MRKKPFFMDEPIWLRLVMWAGLLGLLYNMGFILFHEYDQRGSLEKISNAFGMLTFAFYFSRDWYLGRYKNKA